MLKKSSHLTGFHPTENHKETLFDNPMLDKFSKYFHSDDTHKDLDLEIEGSPQLSRNQATHKRYIQLRYARKKKLPDQKLFISTDAESSSMKN